MKTIFQLNKASVFYVRGQCCLTNMLKSRSFSSFGSFKSLLAIYMVQWKECLRNWMCSCKWMNWSVMLTCIRIGFHKSIFPCFCKLTFDKFFWACVLVLHTLDLMENLPLHRDSSARLVEKLLRCTFSTMHIITSNSQSKLDIFLQEKVCLAKLKGGFGCGADVVSVKMEARNLQKEY